VIWHELAQEVIRETIPSHLKDDPAALADLSERLRQEAHYLAALADGFAHLSRTKMN
jgi:hypothetical protein